MMVWTPSAKASQSLALYNPSISPLKSKWLLSNGFVDLLIDVLTSRKKVSNILMNVSKNSIHYNPSISTLDRKEFCSMNFLFENSCSGISNEGLSYFGECLSRISSLRSISLNFFRFVTFVRWICSQSIVASLSQIKGCKISLKGWIK